MTTERAERILAALRKADPDVPSIRELVESCGLSSTSVAQYNLHVLAREGLITIGRKGTARNYRLTPLGKGLTKDEALLARCLLCLERELGARGGALVEDLRARLRGGDANEMVLGRVFQAAGGPEGC